MEFDPAHFLTAISPGSWATIVLMLGMAAVWWIRGMPERRRAANEEMQLKINEAELIRTDYAKQIQEFRLEVHAYRNELHALQLELARAKNMSMRRGDRVNMVLFILRLVMGELRRLDPKSEILAQAEVLLSRVEHEEDDNDPNKSKALNAAEHTEEAARAAVQEVKQSENNRRRRRR